MTVIGSTIPIPSNPDLTVTSALTVGKKPPKKPLPAPQQRVLLITERAVCIAPVDGKGKPLRIEMGKLCALTIEGSTLVLTESLATDKKPDAPPMHHAYSIAQCDEVVATLAGEARADGRELALRHTGTLRLQMVVRIAPQERM